MPRNTTAAGDYWTGLSMLSKSGEDLLKSGLFSDVRVKCLDRTWNLHKAIICFRCLYFDKAFNGQFEEAMKGEIIIRDQEPHELDWVINFLYTGRVPEEFTKAQDLHACVNLFKIADFFEVALLKIEALALIAQKFIAVAHKVQEAGNSYLKKPAETFNCKDLDDFLYAAKTAYNTGSLSYAKLQKPVIGFLTMTRFHIAKDIRFNRVLEEVPGLAVDMVKLLMQADSKGSKSVVATENPISCLGCKTTSAHFFGTAWLAPFITSREGQAYSLHGYCVKCLDSRFPLFLLAPGRGAEMTAEIAET